MVVYLNRSIRMCLIQYECIYFATAPSDPPVEEFIKSLDRRTRQKFFNAVEMLKDLGKYIPQPYCKYIRKGLYELRFKGVEGNVRIIYFFYVDHSFVLLHGFLKKKSKISHQDIQIAKQRMKTFLTQEGHTK